MPKLIIIRGTIGSGKTTLAKTFNIAHFEADMFFMRDGVFTYDRTKIREAHRWCYECAVEAIKRGMDLVVSNSSSRLFEFDHYLKFAKERDYDIRVIRCVSFFGTTHGVPQESQDLMRERFEDYPGEEIYFGRSEHDQPDAEGKYIDRIRQRMVRNGWRGR